MNVKFSIVIPVYNVAPYLRECLESVQAQTLANWEAICVDDGSTDGSGAILDMYASKEKRLRVFHQENAGVSAARNLAIDKAQGEYILFTDPDDVLLSDYIEHLYSLVKEKPDFIGSIGWKMFSDEGLFTEKEDRQAAWDGEHDSQSAGMRFQMGGLWCSIFPRAVIGSRRLSKGLDMCEDAEFLVRVVSHCKGVVIDGSYHGYRYRIRQKSLCHGRPSLEIAKCCWDDLLVLSKSDEAKENPFIVREWLVRCVGGHLPVNSIGDAVSFARMTHTNRELWRIVLDLPDREMDVKYKTYKRAYARPVARIMSCGMPCVAGGGLFVYFIWWRIRGRILRMIGAKET